MAKQYKKEAPEVVAAQEDLLEEVLEEAAIAPAVVTKAEIEPLAVLEGQLGIYENRVVNVPEGARVAVVENLGGGEMYVDNSGIHYTVNYLLTPGSKKEYKGSKVLFLGSASRPNFRVSFYK